MSTRSNILITDGREKLLFYRHSDGYPTGQGALIEYMKAIQNGKIRNDVGQSAGWLIILGWSEYGGMRKEYDRNQCGFEVLSNGEEYNSGWKVGAYEPTDFYGSDIEFFYICDLENMEIRVYSASLWDIEFKNPDGLRNKDNILQAIEEGCLTLLGEIKDFQESELERIEKIKYKD